ncbi:hypothetical protein [Streptomyces sp. NPDC058773]|uniref:hypothetical protein n=1 Tax=Streptomyces sp. NPDC058773 TaxID=3346632 RepID=UPI0036ABD709
MSDNWDVIRASWDATARAVGGAGRRPVGEFLARRAGFGLARHAVALTGEPGAGKTVLFDALSQEVRLGDTEKGRSPDREEGHRNFLLGSLRVRVSVMVVPGQESVQRERALNRTLSGRTSPQGIIHVVCWGYNKMWDRRGQQAMERGVRDSAGTLSPDALRAWHLEKELTDFEDLCDRITQTRAAERSLRWLLVAVTKSDLYWDGIDEARDYYIPGGSAVPSAGESGFCTALRDLADHNDLRIAVVPMSAQLIRHTFSETLAPQLSRLDSVGVGELRDGFYRTLKELL